MAFKVEKLYSGIIENDPSYQAWGTVTVGRDGELLAVCSGNRQGHICPYGRVFFYRSGDGGHTWVGPERLSSGPLDDRDAGICHTRKGTLLVNYFTSVLAFCGNVDAWNDSWIPAAEAVNLRTLAREHGFWMRRSTDNGKSWSEKYLVPLNSPHGPSCAKDGSLLFAGRCLSESPANISRGTRMGEDMVFARSEDDGLTWKIISKIPPPEGHSSYHCVELYALETNDGRILVHIRDQNREPLIQTWQTESSDGGKNWASTVPVTDGHPSHLLSLSDGTLLMSCGWRNSPYGIRLRLSSDQGRSWPDELVLVDDGLNFDLGYPSSAELPDGSIFTLWYQNTGKKSVLKYCRWRLRR